MGRRSKSTPFKKLGDDELMSDECIAVDEGTVSAISHCEFKPPSADIVAVSPDLMVVPCSKGLWSGLVVVPEVP